MAKRGRPTIYSNKLADKICVRLAQGESLLSICKDDGMPHTSTVYQWVLDNDEFSDKYDTARIMQANHMFDELLEIADDGTNDYMEREAKDGSTYEIVNSEVVQRSKLRVDTRKWYLSKLAPKIYGDKLDVTSNNKALPQPLLYALQDNNSNPQNSGDAGEDTSGTGGNVGE